VAVRFYFDADTLGLAKVIVKLRWDVTYPGDPGGVVRRHEREACPITTTDVSDAAWIPIVAAEGWTIVSRDRKIQQRPAEVAAVHNAKLFAIASEEQLDVWRQLEILMCNWRAIDALANERGPFIHRVTRTTMTRLL
jgi:hypothetical protein